MKEIKVQDLLKLEVKIKKERKRVENIIRRARHKDIEFINVRLPQKTSYETLKKLKSITKNTIGDFFTSYNRATGEILSTKSKPLSANDYVKKGRRKLSEEERKERKRASQRRYYQKNKAKILAKQKEYRERKKALKNGGVATLEPILNLIQYIQEEISIKPFHPSANWAESQIDYLQNLHNQYKTDEKTLDIEEFKQNYEQLTQNISRAFSSDQEEIRAGQTEFVTILSMITGDSTVYQEDEWTKAETEEWVSTNYSPFN